MLALLTAVGPISTDMYLPAFPAMKLALAAAPGAAQITLAAWFVGLAVGQITHGPLADHYGRRSPLLLGTGLYTVASIGCAISTSMPELSCWRGDRGVRRRRRPDGAQGGDQRRGPQWH